MTSEELLKVLGSKGVSVYCSRGKLKVEAPAGVITQPIMSQLEQHRDAIIALISQQPQSDQMLSEMVGPQPSAQQQMKQELEAKVEALFEELGRSPGWGMEYKQEGHPAHETWLEFERCWRELQEIRSRSTDPDEGPAGKS